MSETNTPATHHGPWCDEGPAEEACETCQDPPGPRKIDMDNVARLVRQAGVACIVEQTGGGVATLFAGVRTGYEYQAAAGPGHFQDFRNGYFADPWAYDSEFYVSKDDQGESGDYIDCEGLNDERIAAHILAIVRS